jgi:hypothetical protein
MKHTFKGASRRLSEEETGLSDEEQREALIESARTSLEQAIMEVRAAEESGDRDRLDAAVLTLESFVSARATARGEEEEEELLDARRRNAVLQSYPGFNNIERAMAYLEKKSPAFAAQSLSKRIFLAGQFCNTGRIPRGGE